MPMIDIDRFVSLSIDWARDRSASFRYNWPVKGGWEGWIQVDLVASILRTDPTSDILREQPVFAAGRVDLLMNAQQARADQQLLVELRAQSMENRGNFVTGVRQDVDKIANGRSHAWARSPSAIVAIGFVPEDVQEVLRIAEAGQRIFRDVYSAGREVAVLVACWRFPEGWIAA